MYVPNLTSQSHHAAIPESRRSQRFLHTDLHATASVLDVPHFPLVLMALLRLVKHGNDSGQIDSTENSGHRWDVIFLTPIAESTCGRNSLSNLSVSSHPDSLQCIRVGKGTHYFVNSNKFM